MQFDRAAILWYRSRTIVRALEVQAVNLVRVHTGMARRARLKLGLMLGDLATRSKLHPNTVRMALRGGRVSPGSARKIARALRLPVSELILAERDSNEQATEDAEVRKPTLLGAAFRQQET
jgi:transcriptional regulator with XRE-family HTH domain